MNLPHPLLLLGALTWLFSVFVTPATAQTPIPVQTHTPVNLNQTNPQPEYSYYVYLPQNYYTEDRHPLLINFHGVGERGPIDGSQLSKVLQTGPAKLIENGIWDKQKPFVNQPFIVISPQSWASSGFFGPDNIKKFLEDLLATYKVDPDRVYLTGLSSGAFSSYEYFARYGSAKVAAAVLIAGRGSLLVDHREPCSEFERTTVWAFHGADDDIVPASGSINPINHINANCKTKDEEPWKLTIYPGVGHDSWTRTYDLTGINQSADPIYDPFDENIYHWLLRHSKKGTSPKNQLPTADAGRDSIVHLPTQLIHLDGSASSDPDGTITTYAWVQISGPGEATLLGQDSIIVQVSDLQEGTYAFQLEVTDDRGATASDQVAVVVEAALMDTVNFWFEAECVEVGEFWTKIVDDRTSGNGYVRAAPEVGHRDSPPEDPRRQVTFTTVIPQAGNYQIFAQCWAYNAQNDSSFLIRINDGPWQPWGATKQEAFEWKSILDDVHGLKQGTNTIQFTSYQENVRLDKLLISSIASVPSDLGDTTSSCSNAIPTTEEEKKEEALVTSVDQPPAPSSPLVYPNPAHEQFTIECPAVGRGNTTMWSLVDLSGSVILKERPIIPGKYTITVPTYHLPEGMYILRWMCGQKWKLLKLLVDH